MRFEFKSNIGGKVVITTSTRFLFWHIIREYEAQREFPRGYWDWLKLPNRDLVPSITSFQLDAWNKCYGSTLSGTGEE